MVDLPATRLGVVGFTTISHQPSINHSWLFVWLVGRLLDACWMITIVVLVVVATVVVGTVAVDSASIR